MVPPRFWNHWTASLHSLWPSSPFNKYRNMISPKYHIHIWQLWSQHGCDDTCQTLIGFTVVCTLHYSYVIMGAKASLITSVSIVYSTVCSSSDQRKHHSSASVVFVRRINRSAVNSPKGPATRKMFPFDDVIMSLTMDTDTANPRLTRSRDGFMHSI